MHLVLTAAELLGGLALGAGQLAFVDLTWLRGLLGVVIGVGALIFFHELGHFLAAKWAGVRVEVFSLGFGQRLVGFERGGTDYRISMLPLGGYVKMLGQADDDPSQARTERDDDFRNKSVFKRFVILVAGVVMNLILAAVGFVLAFGMGVSFTAPEIGFVEPGSPAARADLRPGDIVLAIDGSEVLGWQDVQMVTAISDDELTLDVWRAGDVHQTRVTPVRRPDETFARLGVGFESVIAQLGADSPLAKAGAKAATAKVSDTILNVSPIDSRVDPTTRMNPLELNRALDTNASRLAVTLERTHYDPESGLPLERELVPVEFDVPRKPEYGVGLQVPDQLWVRHVVPGSAAHRAGVQEGDRIISLNGVPITMNSLNDVVRETGARLGEQQAVPLVIERPRAKGDVERHELQVKLELENEEAVAAALEGIEDPARRLEIRRQVGNWLLGVSKRADVVGAPSRLRLADPDAEPVVLQPGDRIRSVWLDGGLWWSKEQEFVSQESFRALLRHPPLRPDPTAPVKISWQPRGTDELRTAVVKPQEVPDDTYADLGVSIGGRQVLIERGPASAVALGMHQTWIQTKRIVLMLRSFLTGSVSPRELGGPIQIVNISYEVATKDTLSKLFHLLAILSVNLAVINILPIPVLDGGHIFFLIVEKLKGRPVSDEVLIYAQWAGLFCILGLMALVFFNDISRLVQG